MVVIKRVDSILVNTNLPDSLSRKQNKTNSEESYV